jgi:hypothetical protein
MNISRLALRVVTVMTVLATVPLIMTQQALAVGTNSSVGNENPTQGPLRTHSPCQNRANSSAGSTSNSTASNGSNSTTGNTTNNSTTGNTTNNSTTGNRIHVVKDEFISFSAGPNNENHQIIGKICKD